MEYNNNRLSTNPKNNSWTIDAAALITRLSEHTITVSLDLSKLYNLEDSGTMLSSRSISRLVDKMRKGDIVALTTMQVPFLGIMNIVGIGKVTNIDNLFLELDWINTDDITEFDIGNDYKPISIISV